PNLRFSCLWAFDGNDSLKRMATQPEREAGDTRIFHESDYFLPRNFVDGFAGEVKSRSGNGKGPQIVGDVSDSESDEPDVAPTSEGDPTDGSLDDKGLEQCVKNWKSAAAEEKKKKAWGVFDETGIFASACRHGSIMWVADMVRSGELAKYPLSMVSMAAEILDPNTMCGYDIGCKFATTVANSSLGKKCKDAGHMFCVNAFHGYTHSYDCQVKHHPNVIDGIGLEDLETLERVFSSSNQLAPIVRHSSPYRRRQLIDAYFRQWDEDKYLNCGTFLLNNYKQALASLEEDARSLDVLKAKLSDAGIDPSDAALDTWVKEERDFFLTLGKEHPWDTFAVAYVELLQRLRQAEAERSLRTSHFYNSIPTSYEFASPTSHVSSYASETSSTARIEYRRRKAVEEYDRILSEVINMEIRMNISPSERWNPTTPQYVATLKYLEERKYQRALEKVQRLVIQRLFELHKLNLAQTGELTCSCVKLSSGYKLRTHLAKSLQTRCKAIRRAVAEYNAAAAKLPEPRPPLNWSQVSHYGFLEEFLLLQDTRNDIRDRPWGNVHAREAMKLRRRIKRAEEEIQRCNVEVRRLHTAIIDEAVLFHAVRAELKEAGNPLLIPVQEFTTRRERINEELLARIHQIHALPGFTGVKTPGVRIGMRPLPQEYVRSDDPSVLIDIGPINPSPPLLSLEDVDEDDDDETTEDVGGLMQYFSTFKV
ncbi:hypothetical protein K474DRAFT_1761098, partial [Panus rudis PR-1116 ss-1]